MVIFEMKEVVLSSEWHFNIFFVHKIMTKDIVYYLVRGINFIKTPTTSDDLNATILSEKNL